MLSFILAGVVFAITLVICVLVAFANGMSDAPSANGVSVMRPFLTGTVVAVLLAASHWLPPISW